MKRPTRTQIEALPKWAQSYLAQLELQRDDALCALSRVAPHQGSPASAFHYNTEARGPGGVVPVTHYIDTRTMVARCGEVEAFIECPRPPAFQEVRILVRSTAPNKRPVMAIDGRGQFSLSLVDGKGVGS